MNTAIAVVLAMAAAGQVATNAPPSEDADNAFEELKAFYRQEVAGYDFSLDTAGREKLTLSKPVLTWTGQDYEKIFNTVGATSGEVYVWTRHGRAFIAGGAGSFAHESGRRVFHEFHVLTERPSAPIEIKTPVPKVWTPPAAVLRPIPGASEPVTAASEQLTDSLRLSQMRRLARQFSAATETRPGEVNRLEMRPAPIYRLDRQELARHDSPVVDGSLFAFTGGLGTDPDALLLIECHKTDDGLQWMYAPARFTFLATSMDHQGERVWEVPFRVGAADREFVSEITVERITMEEIREKIQESSEGANQ